MKTTLKHLVLLTTGAGLIFSCDPKIDEPTPTTEGKIDVSNYISIGNSLTAGFASNGLFREGQKYAYPILIAEQFKQAGGGEFNAPLFPEDQKNGTGYLRLDGFYNPSSPILTSVPADPNAVAGKSPFAYNPSLNPDSIVLKPYEGPTNHNYGVPGIRVADLETVGYGYPNSYFGRMLTEGEKMTTSYSAKVLAQKPSFFTCWLGNNDVLGYSTAGGYVDLGKITPAAEFQMKYTNFINALVATEKQPKGVLANIPDVTSIPFFTTVTPSVKSALVSKGVPAFYEFKFDSIFQNTVIPALVNPDPNVVILDPAKSFPWPTSRMGSLNSVTGKIEGDVFLTLTFSPYASLLGKPSGKAWKDIIHKLVNTFVLPSPFDQLPKDLLEASVWTKSGLDTTQLFGFHPKNPIPDVFVLNPNETARARAAVSAYNEIIKNLATVKNLGHVDANTFLSNITRGAYYDGIATSTSFISGGAFSLDGVHLTPRGNALAANEFIKAINAAYGTKITVLNPGQYKGVIFP